jgi:tetratricopeptide (TPR) repeat protein
MEKNKQWPDGNCFLLERLKFAERKPLNSSGWVVSKLEKHGRHTMLSQSSKILAIRFQQPQFSALLQQVEELYIYGVLIQMTRYGVLYYRDFATLSEKIDPEPGLSYAETLQVWQQFCQSTRTQLLFTGMIQLLEDVGRPPELKINYKLYAEAEQRILVDETVRFFAHSGGGEEGNLSISLDDLCTLINQTAFQFLQAIFGEEAFPAMAWAPFSQSMKAVQLLLKAHKTSIALEKISLYEQALKEDPTLETAYTHLARIYKNEGEYEKSVLCYREALKFAKCAVRNKAIYATEGGISCALLGRLELAQQWWLRALEYDADYIIPYFNLANTYEDLENYELSEKYFLEAQRIAPEDFRTFFNLARIYSKMGQWEKALRQYGYQLQSGEESDPWCHSDVATCYLNLGDVENAKQHLQQTITLDPEGEAGQYAQFILMGFA